jgi:hypothetical protein
VNAERGTRSAESKGCSQLECDGFQILESVLPSAECDVLAAELTLLLAQQRGKAGGVRNLLRISARVAQLANSPTLLELAEKSTGSSAFPVRAILFDKNPTANWLVPWHQDLSIAVAERIETAGFTGWSVKDGVPHVLPPPEILAGMLTVRLHLDDCTAGVLTVTEFEKWKQRDFVVCEVPKGGALLMRPLLLHASSLANEPSHRRVLHIEYAAIDLPSGLQWFERA